MGNSDKEVLNTLTEAVQKLCKEFEDFRGEGPKRPGGQVRAVQIGQVSPANVSVHSESMSQMDSREGSIQSDLANLKVTVEMLCKAVAGLQAAINFKVFQSDLAEVVERHGGSPRMRVAKDLTYFNCGQLGHKFPQLPSA